MRKDAIDLVRRIRELHTKTHIALKELSEFLKNCHDENEAADLAYAFSESYKWTDDMRKSFKQLREISERVTCLILITKGTGATVKTEYVSATPKVGQIASIPNRNKEPEQFAKLMDFLGIKRELWDTGDEDEVIRPHWPGLVAWLTNLQAAGKPLPPGINPEKTYPVYALHLRPRKGVISDD